MGEASPQTHKQGCLCLSRCGIHIKILSFFPFFSLSRTHSLHQRALIAASLVSITPFFPRSQLSFPITVSSYSTYIFTLLLSLSLSCLRSHLFRRFSLSTTDPEKVILSRVSNTEQYYYHHILITHYRRKKSRFLSALSQWRWWDICLFVECLAIYIQWYSQRAHKRYSLPWKWWCFLKPTQSDISLEQREVIWAAASELCSRWDMRNEKNCMYPYSMKKCGEEEKRREKYRRALYSRPKIICSSFPNILMRSSIQT